MKKRLMVASLLVGLLAAGLAGGAVLARDGGGSPVVLSINPDGDSPKGDFAARVASILGLETEQVESAMEQAAQELKAEQLDAKLDSLVEKGLLTQDTADAYKAWLSDKPNVDLPALKRHKAWSRGFPGKGFHAFGELWAVDWLAKLVESGKLTQEDADAYQAWLDARPEVDFLAFKGSGERGEAMHGKDYHGFGDKR
ncbi:MAG: hypothetical protein OYI31_07360 [Chloroflexota bacterium]|nr:hypothetical protein [Chloroflexota bacterium]MDE2942349.1 hypothetical protein [Chloroflexota bacterium]MDE3268246.1 hypothetical protein [Chloroflexota bacterium]